MGYKSANGYSGAGGGGGGGAATSVTIDVTVVTGGTANAVLFVNPTGSTIGDDPNFLYVAGVGANAINLYAESNTASSASTFSLFRRRSSGAAANGDLLGTVGGLGYDGSTYQTNSNIRFAVDGVVSAGAVPTAIEFSNSATNSAGASVKMFISSAGNVGINYGASSAALGAKLDVKAAGTGDTDIAFRARNSANTANLFQIAGDGSFGNGALGAASFYFSPNVSGTGRPQVVLLAQSDTASSCTAYVGLRTRAGFAAVQNGDKLTQISSAGFDGVSLYGTALIDFVVDATVSAGVLPTGIEFNTGTTSLNSSTKLYINSAGRVGIGVGGLAQTAYSLLDVKGSFGANITTVSVDTTLNETHYTLEVNAVAAERTITLPAAASANRRIYNIKKIDASANLVVLVGAGGTETIDGLTSQDLANQWASIQIQSNGTSWAILGRYLT